MGASQDVNGESPVNNPEQPKTSAGNPASAVIDAGAFAAAPIRAVWERVKHHKVVQWTLAYLALAYTLLHSAELLGSSLGWSHGLLRLFTLLLILGVPVVIMSPGTTAHADSVASAGRN